MATESAVSPESSLMKPNAADSRSNGLAILGAIVLLAALGATYGYDQHAKGAGASAVMSTAICLLGILGLYVCLGVARTGRLSGILITPRNVMSLSRLQMALWTAIVLAVFAAAALARLGAAGVEQPLNIAVSGEIWGLLGISAASLVGSPLLLTMRAGKSVVEKDAAGSKAPADDAVAKDLRADGPVYRNLAPTEARFADIFEGDEIANTDQIDLAKVQMFVFTMIGAVVWTVGALKVLSGSTLLGPILDLPSLPAGMVTLLGVSNMGFLASKLIDHTPTQ